LRVARAKENRRQKGGGGVKTEQTKRIREKKESRGTNQQALSLRDALPPRYSGDFPESVLEKEKCEMRGEEPGKN